MSTVTIDTKKPQPSETLKKATDMSGGPKFKNFTRSERRELLGMLEESSGDMREMVAERMRWIKLGEKLHPGEYSRQFPKAASLFTVIRQGVKGRKIWPVKGYNSLLEKAFKKGITAGMEQMHSRPDEFIKRMDWLVRTQTDVMGVIEIMRNFKIASVHMTKEQVEKLREHFSKRDEPVVNRTRNSMKLPDLPAIETFYVTYVLTVLDEIINNK